MDNNQKLFNKITLFCKKNLALIISVVFLLELLTTIKGFWTSGSIAGMVYRTLVSLFVFFLASILFFEAKQEHRKIVIYLIFGATVFSIIGIFTGVINLPFTTIFNILIIGDNILRLLLLISFLIIYFFASKFVDTKGIKFFLFLLIVAALVSGICGLIFDYKDFVNVIFDKEGQNFDFDSFFLTKNYFGLVLSFGLIALTIVPFVFKYRLRKTFALIFVVLSLFIFVLLIVSRAKTSILAMLFYYVGFFFFYTKKQKRLPIFLIIISCFLLFFLLWYFITPIYSLFSFSEKINYFLKHAIVQDSKVVISSRLKNWCIFFEEYNWRLIFGLGDRSFYYLIKQDIGLISLDNAYISFLGQGGVFKLAISIFVIYIIYSRIVKDGSWPTMAIYTMCIFLLYGLLLDFSFANLSFESIGFTLILLSINRTPINQKFSE